MPAFYRRNLIPFTAMVLALLFCIPLMAVSTKAKEQKTAAVSSSLSANSSDDTAYTQAGLVNLAKMDAGLVINMRYATTNNFTGGPLYSGQKAYLRAETANKLAAANRAFMASGYRIVVMDAYRPYSVQKILYAKVPDQVKWFIANPYAGGSNHNRGTAVDITLEHLDGSPVPMPTDFDTFSYDADIRYQGGTQQQRNDREFLASVMVQNGFRRLECEWWHFDDTDAEKYGILDIPI